MKIKNIIKLIISIIICQSAGIIGSFFTVPAITGWYVNLEKPILNPPNWIFGPVWVTLYFLMAIALFLIWQKGWQKKEIKIALSVFTLQLLLNSSWSVVFFGLKNPGLAFLNITLLLILIAWTIILFYKISKKAAYLLVPYFIWVSFASYLNFAIWMLN